MTRLPEPAPASRPRVTVREAQTEDLPTILELARTCFAQARGTVPVNYSLAHLRWILRDPPAGSYVGSLAYHDDIPVGFYGVIPIDLTDGRRPIRGALSLLTMTDPGYRGQGILTQLASHVYERLTLLEYDIVYGFPNDNSLPVLTNRLGWHHVDSWSLHAHPLRLGSLLPGNRPERAYDVAAATAGESESSGGIDVRVIELFDEKLAAVASDEECLRVVRNAGYLNWRYVACPDWKYHLYAASEGDEPVGYMVLRLAHHRGRLGVAIMDIQSKGGREDVIRLLISRGVKEARAWDVDVIVALPSEQRSLSRLLRKRGFFRIPQLVPVKRFHFGYRLLHAGASAHLEPVCWHLGLGDIDIL